MSMVGVTELGIAALALVCCCGVLLAGVIVLVVWLVKRKPSQTAVPVAPPAEPPASPVTKVAASESQALTSPGSPVARVPEGQGAQAPTSPSPETPVVKLPVEPTAPPEA